MTKLRSRLSTLFAPALGVYTVSSLNLVSNEEEQHDELKILKLVNILRRAVELSAIFEVRRISAYFA